MKKRVLFSSVSEFQRPVLMEDGIMMLGAYVREREITLQDQTPESDWSLKSTVLITSKGILSNT